MTTKTIRHYLQFKDFSLEDYEYVLERTGILKRKFKNYETYHPLHDRTLAMIFEKPTRTRLSFEAGIFQLGGHAVFMSTRDTQLGRGEPVEDSAQVISRMVDIIMIRTFEQDVIKRFADNSRVPVINGLTNESTVPGARRHLHVLRAPRPDRRQDRCLGRRCEQHALRGSKPRRSSASSCACPRRPATRST